MAELREVDPLVWRACVGYNVKVPVIGSMVFYFPQGHAEQASSNVDLSSVPLHRPYLLSRVISVKYLVDAVTDQVYVRIGLDPRPYIIDDRPNINDDGPQETAANASEEQAMTQTQAQSFAKILTLSDANNGGGFSVPRFCAEIIFPEMDLLSEMPTQQLELKDLVGKEWKFRHIYRGVPRRHLLTTGWSSFVDKKKLVAGDAVVFVKDGKGGILVGIRRKLCGVVMEGNGEVEGFVRNGRGRVAAAAVVEAVTAAVEGSRVYDVDYYPERGSPEFVVPVELVERVKMERYSVGTKVRMRMKTEDKQWRESWCDGVVDKLHMTGSGAWACSPWRTLEV